VVNSTGLVTTNTFGSLWDTWTIPFDGLGFLPSPHQRRLALTPVTADHRHFVVTYLMDAGVLARTFLVPVDASDMNFINLTQAGASVSGAALFEDGNALVQRQNVGWQVMQVGSSGATAGPVLDGNTVDYFFGTVGRYAVFQDTFALYPIHAAREDSAITNNPGRLGRPQDPARAPSLRPPSLRGLGADILSRCVRNAASRWRWTLRRPTSSSAWESVTGTVSST